MAREVLTGTRIRERRLVLGLKQAELARRTGISSPYLNLIEHNRRRIGGKLLLDIAAVLEVEPQALTVGAEMALVAALRDAGDSAGLDEDEADRVEELVGRFPGWARVLADGQKRVSRLERMVEALSDRMAHDPQLAASLHELLTTTAAIRSTAAILAETGDLSASMQSRFHDNMHQDAQRLSDSARTLVRFLDADATDTGATGTAQDEVDAWLAERNHDFAELEEDTQAVSDIVAEAGLSSSAARHLATAVLDRVARDADALPGPALLAQVQGSEIDPQALAMHFGLDVPLILRRLASLPELGLGLVIADQAGGFVFRKPVEGFSVPRYGVGCALWPLFRAFAQPALVLRQRLMPLGQTMHVFDTFATSYVSAPVHYNEVPLREACMLLVPVQEAEPTQADLVPVGVTCRICPASRCHARREASILQESHEI